MVRAILQVRERRTSRPQPVPLLRPRPVTRKLDDHVVIRRLDQLVQTAIIRPVHRPRATGRVYRPLVFVTKLYTNTFSELDPLVSPPTITTCAPSCDTSVSSIMLIAAYSLN